MTLRGSYEKFHGHGPRTARRVNFLVPKGLMILGEAVSVEYRCEKLNGGGDGKRAIYRHTFGPGAILTADQGMKKQLYVLGPKIKVTNAGIEG